MKTEKLFDTRFGQFREKMALEIERREKTFKSDLVTVRKTQSSLQSVEANTRTDISIISNQAPDWDNEVMLIAPLDYDYFLSNGGKVYFNHKEEDLPIAHCEWMTKQGTDLLAKTRYLPRNPDNNDPWLPDAIWHLVRMSPCMMAGKSINALTIKRRPTKDEVTMNPDWKGMMLLDQGLVIEYSCVNAPSNTEAVILEVTKSIKSAPAILKRLGIALPTPKKNKPFDPQRFEEMVTKQIEAIDVDGMVREVLRSL
jgi:hypothetical protein